MDVFLRLNGITVTMDEDPIVQMMVDAAAGQLGHEALADRIADHLYELFSDLCAKNRLKIRFISA